MPLCRSLRSLAGTCRRKHGVAETCSAAGMFRPLATITGAPGRTARTVIRVAVKARRGTFKPRFRHEKGLRSRTMMRSMGTVIEMKPRYSRRRLRLIHRMLNNGLSLVDAQLIAAKADILYSIAVYRGERPEVTSPVAALSGRVR